MEETPFLQTTQGVAGGPKERFLNAMRKEIKVMIW